MGRVARGECRERGCRRRAHARGMCAGCYSRWHRGERGTVQPMAAAERPDLRLEVRAGPDGEQLCGVDGCGDGPHARGMCRRHVKRWERYGDPAAVHARGPRRQPPTSEGGGRAA